MNLNIKWGLPFAADLEITESETDEPLDNVVAGAIFFDCSRGNDAGLMRAVLLTSNGQMIAGLVVNGEIKAAPADLEPVYLDDVVIEQFSKRGYALPWSTRVYLRDATQPAPPRRLFEANRGLTLKVLE